MVKERAHDNMSLCYTSQSLFPFALVIWLLPWTLIILLSVVREDDPRVDTIFIVVLRVKKHSEPEQNDERCKDAGFGQAKKNKKQGQPQAGVQLQALWTEEKNRNQN